MLNMPCPLFLSLFSPSGPKAGTTQANGQIPQAAHSVNVVLEEAQRQAETTKVRSESDWTSFSDCLQ